MKYNKFVSGLAVRRVAEHRSKVTRAQIKTNIQILESAPGNFVVQWLIGGMILVNA